MISERAVDEYRINKGMYKPDKWISIPIGRYWIPVLPAWGFKDWLFLHDAHRLFNDFSTGMAGEAELFAWEIGSGRFGRRWWIRFGLIDFIFFAMSRPALEISLRIVIFFSSLAAFKTLLADIFLIARALM